MFTKDSLTIDLGSSSSNSILFETRQNDTLHLGFSVLNGGRVMDLTNHTIKIYCVDADGTEINYSKGFDIQGKKFYLTLPRYFTDCLGKVNFEFEFTNENGVTTSPTYSYMVKQRVRTNVLTDEELGGDLADITIVARETLHALTEINKESAIALETGKELLLSVNQSIESSSASKEELMEKIDESMSKITALQKAIDNATRINTILAENIDNSRIEVDNLVRETGKAIQTHTDLTNKYEEVKAWESDFNLHETIPQMKQDIEELFQSVGNGKELIASALTDKGIPTLATESFEEIARKILSLNSGEVEELFNITTKNGDSLVTKNGDNLIYKGAM